MLRLFIIGCILLFITGCGVKAPEKEIITKEKKVFLKTPEIMYVETKEVPVPPGGEYLEATNMEQKSMLAKFSIEMLQYSAYLREKLYAIKKWNEKAEKETK